MCDPHLLEVDLQWVVGSCVERRTIVCPHNFVEEVAGENVVQGTDLVFR